MSSTPFHILLGVPENASKEEIKKAYRRLAMQYHPDKNQDPVAHNKFIEISEAYEAMLNGEIIERRNQRHPKSRAQKTTYSRQDAPYEERMRKAKEFAKQKADIEYKKLQYDYNKLKESFYVANMRIVQVASLLFLMMMLYDYFNSEWKNVTIQKHYVDVDARIIDYDVIGADSIPYFIRTSLEIEYPDFGIGHQFEISVTPLLNQVLEIKNETGFEEGNGLTYYGFFGFLCFILLIPSLLPLIKGPTPLYYFGVHVGFYIPPLVILIVIVIYLL